MNGLLAEDADLRFDAYNRACCDKHAADQLGIKKNTFLQWRWSQGLASKKCPTAVLSPENALREYMWKAGADDPEIGYVTGMSSSTIQKWRKRNGLQANKPRGGNLDPGEAAEAIFSTLSDGEAAKELGRLVVTVCAWRKRHAIPIAPLRSRISAGSRSEVFLRRWDAYCLSASTEQAAAMIGVSPLSMSRWIRRNQLPKLVLASKVRELVLFEARRGCRIAKRAAEVRSWLAPEKGEAS